MKFERFQTENMYDYLIIGDPDAFDTADLVSIDYLYDYYINDYEPTGKALIFDGFQPTEIWATAKSITNFDIYFHRIVFKT